jgi:chromosome segregation ATPase
VQIRERIRAERERSHGDALDAFTARKREIDATLQRLTARIAQLTDILSLEQAGKLTLEEQMVQLRASLAATQGERDRYKGLYDELGSGTATAQGKVTELAGQLDQAQLPGAFRPGSGSAGSLSSPSFCCSTSADRRARQELRL